MIWSDRGEKRGKEQVVRDACAAAPPPPPSSSSPVAFVPFPGGSRRQSSLSRAPRRWVALYKAAFHATRARIFRAVTRLISSRVIAHTLQLIDHRNSENLGNNSVWPIASLGSNNLSVYRRILRVIRLFGACSKTKPIVD